MKCLEIRQSYILKIGDDEISSIIKENSDIKSGDTIEIYIYTEKICIFDKETKENILYDSVKGGLTFE